MYTHTKKGETKTLKEKEEFKMKTDIHTKKGNKENMFVCYFKHQMSKQHINSHTRL